MPHHWGRVPVPVSRHSERQRRQGRRGSRCWLLGVAVGNFALILLLASRVANFFALHVGKHGSIPRRGGSHDLTFYRRGAFLFHPLPIVPRRRRADEGREGRVGSEMVPAERACSFRGAAAPPGGASVCGLSLAEPLRAARNRRPRTAGGTRQRKTEGLKISIF